ncbi:hypothetical protein R3W88_024288 [Solanum pinnatisectum]|uniref:Uncharacterized protein n=1 Tax=Solanum pinnatisectum TaxID=50273 RepID=A0AAV9M373_9SOLN|nr:hypothetical protein R3W88_024288 [Solanum pinnatisectum]
MGAGTAGTVKQFISLSTLVECECIEGKTRQMRKMSRLVAEWDQLKHELGEMTTLVGKKDIEMALLKAQLTKTQTDGSITKEFNELKSEKFSPPVTNY